MERQVKVNNWRIIKIDELLQTGKWYTAKEIAKAVDASYSVRTIQRDLEYLRDTLGAPIESGSQGYRYYEKNSISLNFNLQKKLNFLKKLLKTSNFQDAGQVTKILRNSQKHLKLTFTVFFCLSAHPLMVIQKIPP